MAAGDNTFDKLPKDDLERYLLEMITSKDDHPMVEASGDYVHVLNKLDPALRKLLEEGRKKNSQQPAPLKTSSTTNPLRGSRGLTEPEIQATIQRMRFIYCPKCLVNIHTSGGVRYGFINSFSLTFPTVVRIAN